MLTALPTASIIRAALWGFGQLFPFSEFFDNPGQSLIQSAKYLLSWFWIGRYQCPPRKEPPDTRFATSPTRPSYSQLRTFRQGSQVPRNVSGYVCNHGSPSGERDTASPRGCYGERPQRDSVWRYICKNTTCWPATAHDVTTGVPQYKCRRENTSSASSSEACVRSMARSLGDAVSRSPLGEPWLHT